MVLSLPQLREVTEAHFTCLTERELAERRREEGVRVIAHRGHSWEQSGLPGFFQPVHLLARLTPDEATAPTLLSWGFRAALTPETASAATGRVPVARLRDLDTYDVQRLDSNRRGELRQCQRRVRIVQLTGPSVLLEQGYGVIRDALTRTHPDTIPTLGEYLKSLRRYFVSDHWCVLAGLVDGKLGGYLDGYVVDGVAYSFNAYYASWALPMNISTGLLHAFAQVCRRFDARTLVGGLHGREAARLEPSMDGLGFVVDSIPIHWRMNPLARAFLRWRRPHAYSWLTGQS